MTRFHQQLDDIMADSLQAMLVVPVTASRDGGIAGDHDLVAIIGFAGDSLRGCVGVAANLQAVLAVHPLGLDADRRGRPAEDWLAEIANQVLGRVKHRLSGYSMEIAPSTPVVLRGLQIRVARARPGPPQCYKAATKGGSIIAWIDVTTPIADDFELTPGATADAAPGESFFF